MTGLITNKRIKQKEATCRAFCTHWKEVKRKNGMITICAINKKDLPASGSFSIPWWCPIISDYYEKKRLTNKKRRKRK